MSLVTVELPTCPVCGTATLAVVNRRDYHLWRTGRRLIQDAFPDWSADDRELLVTGTHPDCWNTLKGEDE